MKAARVDLVSSALPPLYICSCLIVRLGPYTSCLDPLAWICMYSKERLSLFRAKIGCANRCSCSKRKEIGRRSGRYSSMEGSSRGWRQPRESRGQERSERTIHEWMRDSKSACRKKGRQKDRERAEATRLKRERDEGTLQGTVMRE